MIMKMPSNTAGNGYYGHSDGAAYDLDDDEYDAVQDLEANLDDDFSEYYWMENEEEFDKEEMQRLEEEALMEQCIEAMLEDELLADDDEAVHLEWSGVADSQELCQVLSSLKVAAEDVTKSKLNPLAQEFVPTLVAATAT